MTKGSLDRIRARARSEDGIGLIEVLISAALLIVIIVGVLQGFDAAGHFTSDQQRRAQASALAQQDEDHLRSLPISQLSGLNLTLPAMTINGTQFTINEQAQFITEATGSASCSATGTADYIQTRSIVTWKAMNNTGQTEQTEADSVVTPGAGGGLIVQTLDNGNNGVANVNVSATGPITSGSGGTAYNQTTSSNGCAIFAGLTGGNYNVVVSQAGYVDVNGAASASHAATVIEGTSITPIQFEYDLAGSIATTFTTIPYGGSSPLATNSDILTFVNPLMTHGNRWAGTVGTYASNVTGTNMFPFGAGQSNAYTVYSGTCSNDQPSNNGGTDASAYVAPGGTANVQLQLPPVYATVYSGVSGAPGSPVSGANVVITDLGCAGSPSAPYAAVTVGQSPPAGWQLVKRTFVTNASGQLPNPGLPYGTYSVCTSWTNGASTYHYSYPTNVTNNVLSGTTVPLYKGSPSAGACP